MRGRPGAKPEAIAEEARSEGMQVRGDAKPLLDERTKQALLNAASAMRVLQEENEALRKERDTLKTQVVELEGKLGAVAQHDGSNDSGIGSALQPALPKKRGGAKAALPALSAGTINAVTSSWGRGTQIQFAVDPVVDEASAVTAKSKAAAGGGGAAVKKKQPKQVRAPVAKKAKIVQKEDDSDSDDGGGSSSSSSSGDTSSNDSSSSESCSSSNEEDEDEEEEEEEEGDSLEQIRKKEPGWADINLFVSPAVEEGSEAATKRTSDSVLSKILQGVSRNNLMSCATALAAIPAATVARGLAERLPYIVRCLSRVSPGPWSEPFPGFALREGDRVASPTLLFTPPVASKLELVAEMLAAVCTRTGGGPAYVHKLLSAIRSRLMAAARRDLVNPLRCALLGDRDLKSSSFTGLGKGQGSEDSDSEQEEEEEQEQPQQADEGGTKARGAETRPGTAIECERAALALVLTAVSLRCRMLVHVTALLADLSRLAPSTCSAGITMGVLAAVEMANAGGAVGAVGGAALEVFVRRLGERVSNGQPAEAGGRWALDAWSHCIKATAAACVRLATSCGGTASASAQAGVAEAEQELDIRTKGTLACLQDSSPSGLASDLSVMGIGGVSLHARALVDLLSDAPNSRADAALQTLTSAMFAPLHALPADSSEAALLAALEAHWTRALVATNQGEYRRTAAVATAALKSARIYLSTALGLDFDGVCGGWRFGKADKGHALDERLVKAMERARAVLHNLAGGDGSTLPLPLLPSAEVAAAATALQLYEFTGASPDRLLQAASLDQRLRDESLGPQSAASKPQSLELRTLLAAAPLERLQFLAHCSAWALVRVLLTSPAEKDLDLDLLERAALFLTTGPQCFWLSSMGRADVGQAVQNAAAVLLSRRGGGGELHGGLGCSEQLCAFVRAKSQRVPVLVINLDRRRDRMRKMLLAAEMHGLLLLRVPAVDGRRLESGEGEGGGGAGGTGEGEVSQALVKAVPDSDVARMWDSTLNSSFDSYCIANKAQPLTDSERACAASHVLTWRTVQALRAQLGRGSAASSTPLQVPDGFRESLRGHDDWFLVFEDDASIDAELSAHHGSFHLALQRVMQAAPSDFDILYLGWAIPWKKENKTFKVNDMLLRTSYVWQMHAYVLRGAAVTKLLERLPVDAPLDNFVARLIFEETLVSYAVRTQLVKQEGSYLQRQDESDIRHSGRAFV